MKEIAITIGRFQPVTKAHEALILELPKLAPEHRVFTTQTYDNTKNPLTFQQKLRWLKLSFPNMNISEDPRLQNMFNIITKLVDEGYEKVIMLVGSDRVQEYASRLAPYINKLQIKDLEFISFGKTRNDLDGGLSGISGTLARKCVKEGDYQSFKEIVPSTLCGSCIELFRELQEGLKPKPKAKPVVLPKKNLHLDHIEDLVVTEGLDGAKKAIEMLKRMEHVSVKWDGSPAVIFGIDPESERFFVGTKSVFAKNPKINYTNEDIERNHGYGSQLTNILKVCLRYLPELGITGVLQGDVLFSNENDFKLENINGKWVELFQPNTLVYSVDCNSQIGSDIMHSELGIVFHTKYIGSTLADMIAVFDPECTLESTKNVWVSDARCYHKISPIDLEDCRRAFINLKHNIINDLKLETTYDLFINGKIKSNIGINIFERYPDYAAGEFKTFVYQQLNDHIHTLKSERGKKKHTEKITHIMDALNKNWNNLICVFHFIQTIHKAKMIALNSLNEFKIIDTFMWRNGALIKTSPEGYVLSDGLNSAVKLVDRYEFSQANFWNQKFLSVG